MIEKLQSLWPEITLLTAACVVMITGQSASAAVRRLSWSICAAALIAAGLLAYSTTAASGHALPHMAMYGKIVTCVVGLLLLLMVAGIADRAYEAEVARGKTVFDAIRATRGEFYAFFMFSLTGLMLCFGADDLVWLFLALELVSLPTYIMVATSTSKNASMEAGVKYFFLGALGAATFLYGFALIYGATGATNLVQIHSAFAAQIAAGGLNTIGIVGLILAVVGVSFKIAAVPMHFYTPDVYQGASASVSAFLAFVPKSAGFATIILLLSTVGWLPSSDYPSGALPMPVHAVLWVMAVVTMTVGNVLALLQTSVKRTLAYSSIAHSGYMLVGVIAGPGKGDDFASSGIAAVLFYLLVYGVTNVGTFAVVAAMQRQNRDGTHSEADRIEDLRGMCATNPMMGWTMVICSASLLGLPPLLGFFGKLPLFSAGISGGHIGLVVILGLNSAIAAFYYLRLAAYPLLESPDMAARTSNPITQVPVTGRWLAGVLSVVGVIALAIWPVTSAAKFGATYKTKVAVPGGQVAQGK
ncbi:MAG: NADH-quinone oxidoreductase subunit N [Phycisphaerales bacterium]|nr:NADH-quinone oxidoreductase subunit N [Phycisphaerales bacterium]